MVVLRQNWLHSDKVVVVGQEKNIFSAKWFYSGKSGCIWIKLLYLGKSGFNLIWANLLYSGKNGYNRARW